MQRFSSAVLLAFAAFAAAVVPVAALAGAAPPEGTPLVSAAAPGATLEEASEYYLYDRGAQIGPLSKQQVLDRIATGESDANTFVWTEKLNTWVMITTVLQFAPALAPAEPMQVVAAGDEAAEYYLYDGGVQSGPLSGNDILLGIDDGSIAADALIWQPGWTEWRGLEVVEAFADALSHAPPVSDKYYVAANGERVGPLTEDEMRDRIAGRESGAADLAWKKGMADWAPLSGFTEFEKALTEAAIPPLPDDGPPPLPGANAPPPIPGTVDPALETNLAAAIKSAVGEYFGEAPQAEQDTAIACMAALVAPLDDQAKQELVDTNMGGTGDVPLVEAYRSGLGEEIWGCIPQPAADAVAQPKVETNADFDKVAKLVADVVPTVISTTATRSETAMATSCVLELFRAAGPDLWRVMAETNLNPSREQNDVIEAANPGIMEATEKCLDDATQMRDALDSLLWEVADTQMDIPADNDGLKLSVYGCMREAMEPLSAAEREAVAKEGLDVTPATIARIDGAHPGTFDAVDACEGLVRAALKHDDVVDPPPAEKTLLQAVRESLLAQGTPATVVDQIAACATGIFATMSTADQQILIDVSPGAVTTDQEAELTARYPDMVEQLERCAPPQ
jgi:hypothetical protein